MSHIPGGALHTGDRADVIYGAGGEEDFVLKLFHGKTDAIWKVEPGPGLTEGLLEKLKDLIESDLIKSPGSLIGREMLLAESVVDGYFRYQDHLQLIPAPAEAPRPGPVSGLSARHPFVLEVRFQGSANSAINGFRRFRAARDLEFALTSLLRGSIRSARSGMYRWVVPTFGEDLPSTFMREGYRWSTLAAEGKGFSAADGVDPIGVLPAEAYYAREPWTLTSTLSIPDNLSDQLSRFYSLTSDQRRAWLRGCYWLHHSSYVSAYSTSAAFAALVIAVECLIPGVAGKSGKKFRTFVSKFMSHPIPEERLEALYAVRVNVLHGSNLVYSDREPLSVGVTPAMTQAATDFTEMRRITKTVLANWLAAQPVTPAT